MSKILKIPQVERGENPSVVIIDLNDNRTGRGPRNLEHCFITIRGQNPQRKFNYLVIYPDQKLLDKKWDRVVIEAIVTGGAVTSLRLRKARDDESGRRLNNKNPSARPTYETTSRIKTARARVRVEPRFEGQFCFIDIPQEWDYRLEAAS